MSSSLPRRPNDLYDQARGAGEDRMMTALRLWDRLQTTVNNRSVVDAPREDRYLAEVVAAHVLRHVAHLRLQDAVSTAVGVVHTDELAEAMGLDPDTTVEELAAEVGYHDGASGLLIMAAAGMRLIDSHRGMSVDDVADALGLPDGASVDDVAAGLVEYRRAQDLRQFESEADPPA